MSINIVIKNDIIVERSLTWLKRAEEKLKTSESRQARCSISAKSMGQDFIKFSILSFGDSRGISFINFFRDVCER